MQISFINKPAPPEKCSKEYFKAENKKSPTPTPTSLSLSQNSIHNTNEAKI